jgi:flagellar export protein FliJ
MRSPICLPVSTVTTNKLKRFGGLERLAEGEEREASRRLKQRIDDVLAQRTKLDQLQTYLEEYRDSGGHTANQKIDPMHWENYRRFLDQLSQTIEAQAVELAEAESRYRDEAARWQASHARTETLSRLLAKYEGEQKRKVARREQKEMDDRVGRAPGKPPSY